MAKKSKAKRKDQPSSRNQMVSKSLGMRINELTQSLLVMRDCIDLVRRGKLHHFLPLYGQLRLLLTEKSRNNEPLLLAVSKGLGIPLNVGFTPLNHRTAPENTIAIWVPLDLNIEPNAFDDLLTIDEFLDSSALYFDGRPYTSRELIRSFAVNRGGAHFSAPSDFASMVAFMEQPLQHNLLEIAEATYTLGVRLLQNIRDLEIHAYVAFPKQTFTQDAYVFDFKYPSNVHEFCPLRLYCKFRTGGRLVFGVVDLNGASYETEGLTGVLGSEPFVHLAASVHVRNDLKTDLCLCMNDNLSSSVTVDIPLAILHNLYEYTCYYNRSYEDEKAGLTYANTALVIGAAKWSQEDKNNTREIWRHLVQNQEKPCALFQVGDYLYQEPGVKDMQASDNLRWTTVREVKSGRAFDVAS